MATDKTHATTIQVSAMGTTISKTVTNTGTAIQSIEEDIPQNSTDLQVAFVLDVSACKSFYAVSDKALTIETNNGAAPGNTIVLVANEPYEWNSKSKHTFLLTVDVTALFITTGAVGTANLKIEALTDATP